jgi:Fur family ferric uptake transcriptional regulator
VAEHPAVVSMDDVSSSAANTAALHTTVEQRLRQVEQRYTDGRRAVIELLVAAAGPISIGDIADRRPDLPRSSAYRHLVDLQAAGVVTRLAANDEFARFELAEDLTEHHHHLLCTQCGRVIDITLAPSFERSVTHHLGELAEAEGFAPHSHRIDVLGLCSSCR